MFALTRGEKPAIGGKSGEIPQWFDQNQTNI
jgi:hypothetical protein